MQFQQHSIFIFMKLKPLLHILNQLSSTRSSTGKMFPAKHFCVTHGDIWNEKNSLTLPFAKSTYNAEGILKIYELIISADREYVTNPFCKTVLKLATTCRRLKISVVVGIFWLFMIYKQTNKEVALHIKLHIYLLFLHSVYWVSCRSRAEPVLPNLGKSGLNLAIVAKQTHFLLTSDSSSGPFFGRPMCVTRASRSSLAKHLLLRKTFGTTFVEKDEEIGFLMMMSTKFEVF